MPLLEIQNLQKSFPGVVALAGVDFGVRSGEIHALMGENGAGKSTLIKVLTGVHPRDGGQVMLGGESIHPNTPHEAEAIGISTVYQEVSLIPHLSIAENILLGRQPKRWGMIDWKTVRQTAEKALDRIGLRLDVRREAASYSVAIQQMVTIARAIDLEARLLILDEPTSSLDQKEVDQLFTVMRRLRDQGMGIVFVTHFLDQVDQIADRITVLRNGKWVGEYPTEDLSRLDLISKMLGKDPEAVRAIEASQAMKTNLAASISKDAPVVLEANQLTRRGSIEPIDLKIHRGEVVGLAGLLGSGRTECARLLFGLDGATQGTLAVDGKQASRWSPRRAINAGIAFCPEDRKADGVVAELSVRENIVLAMQARRSIAKTLSRSKQLELARHYIDALGIKTSSTETAVGTLSGGNQQKVLLARWLAMSPKIIILDEPTRGIDVGAKAEIESLIDSLRDEGMAVLLISSELEEVVRLCGRFAVLRDREKVGELAGHEIDEQAIMRMIAQAGDDQNPQDASDDKE